MSIDLWLSSGSDFLLSYAAGMLLILGVRTHLDLKAETARSAYLFNRWTEGRLHALRVRVNPHFVVNTLKTTRALISVAPQRAEQILRHLAELMQRTLTESGNELVPVHIEAECLRAYLEIQKLRFPELLNFRVDVAHDVAQCMVPTMILQPIVEDAIVRNAGQRDEVLQLDVRIARHADFVELILRGNCPADDSASSRSSAMVAGTLERLRALFGNRHEVCLADVDDRSLLARLRLPTIESALATAV
jgi:two-component system sensor histidine kinase AlgZ